MKLIGKLWCKIRGKHKWKRTNADPQKKLCRTCGVVKAVKRRKVIAPDGLAGSVASPPMISKGEK